MKKFMFLFVILAVLMAANLVFSQVVLDGDDSDWATVDSTEWIDNVAGLFPAEVGAIVTDRVDMKCFKGQVIGNVFYAFIRFWGSPAWPNEAYAEEKDGVNYTRSRGYYHMLLDLDNDANTGWNTAYFEQHFTTVGYLQDQGESVTPIGAELMVEWGAQSEWAYNGGGMKEIEWWAADYSEYDGQLDTGSEYEIYYAQVPEPDTAKSMKWQGDLTLESGDWAPIDADTLHSYFFGSAWGNDFIEYAVDVKPIVDYFKAKQGNEYFKAGDVIGFTGHIETPIDDWGVDTGTRGELTVAEDVPVRPKTITFDGDDSDWANVDSVSWIDNVAGLFPAEVGAIVTDRVDLKTAKCFVSYDEDALYYLLRFWGSPAWPNEAYAEEKDGVNYTRSRGYYHMLLDLDNDVSTGWNTAYFEQHFTTVGYVKDQGQNADPIGAEVMVEWGGQTQWLYDGGGAKEVEYWWADYSEYNGQLDTGSEYEIASTHLTDPDSMDLKQHDGVLLNRSSDDAAMLDAKPLWGASAWGDDFIEVGQDIRPLKKWFMMKYGQDVLKAGDVIGFAGHIETPIDDWGVDTGTRGETTVMYTDIADNAGQAIPTDFVLKNNYPNPFNPETVIEYSLPTTTEVSLIVYNSLGQKVRTLVNGQTAAGFHSIRWDGKNDFGQQLSSGIYYYRLHSSNTNLTKRMVLLK